MPLAAMFLRWCWPCIDGTGAAAQEGWGGGAIPQGLVPGGPPALPLEGRGDLMLCARNCGIENNRHSENRKTENCPFIPPNGPQMTYIGFPDGLGPSKKPKTGLLHPSHLGTSCRHASRSVSQRAQPYSNPSSRIFSLISDYRLLTEIFD